VIDAGRLLADLQRLLKTIENDLRRRCADNPDVDTRVRAEYNKAKSASRTSQAYEVWRDEFITQVAVAWILACVFVRFIEDNQMLDQVGTARAWLAGPGERLRLARDHHTLYFREHPTETDREYLEHVFRTTANPTGRRPIPVVQALFDEEHNPLWRLGVSGDGATALLNFWQQVEPETGELRHDFTDSEWNTRFLGDLYQDLSEAARKKYALLQTPEFVEEFILDRTLGQAIDGFGYQAVRVIDPTCGSGHFLLGTFERLFELYVRNEPGVNAPELARRALGQVYGVDLNPFAVAIARFRLLVAALKASGVGRLQDAPGFEFNLAVGDSLLHGPPRSNGGDQLNMTWSPIAHVYEAEDKEQLDRLLVPGHYHVVVGNPPYITVKDAALNKAYRERFGSCSGKYSLAVPFTERFFDFALAGDRNGAAGFVGMITANSFMKRSFGKKLIETYIPTWNLTHVIDTSKAHIPGHGIPTVILLGRNSRAVAETIRAVMGIKAEAKTPIDPAQGLVWVAIKNQIDVAGSQSEFVSVADVPRQTLNKHPWSLGGGGAAELKEVLDENAVGKLEDIANQVGITAVTGEDDLYIFDNPSNANRLQVEVVRPLIVGERVRDWLIVQLAYAIWLYDSEYKLRELSELPNTSKLMWKYKASISKRKRFGTPMLARGLTWYEWQELYINKLQTPLSITFSNIGTHNHFVLDRGGRVFNSHAPVIKLKADSDEGAYQQLLGLLNSSTGCFWMKQVFHNKGGGGISEGLRTESWEQFYELDNTKIKQFPLPDKWPLDLPRMLDELAQKLQTYLPASLIEHSLPINSEWKLLKQEGEIVLSKMVALQEELDWQCYTLYDLVENELLLSPRDVPPVSLGERAFEIVMARKMAAGELQTTWFERHSSTPTTEIPARWPEEYRRLLESRIEAIEQNPNIRLIEQPEYKRRWNTEPWDAQAKRALREWLLNRLEDARYWTAVELTTTARLADRVRSDHEFMQVAEMYRGRSDFDVANLVAELVKSEAVPFLPILRYKPSGLRNRQVWEQVWEVQRREDAIDARCKLPTSDSQRLSEAEAKRLKAEQVGDIPVPPKYKSADFLEQTFWRLRGKLDVPKERFVSYPKCERDADLTLPIAWAGWDHLQQARALAAYYEQMKTNEGWGVARLVPLLAGILELLPWLEQWHNEVDPTYGIGMGDFFRGFVEEEARAHGLTLNKIHDWSPSA
jgi:SAM-dependent methyltransferase